MYRALALKAGWEIVDAVKPATYDENEWRELIPRMKAKAPEVVLLLLNKNDLRVFLLRAKELRFQTTFFASKNAYDAIRGGTDQDLYEGLCFTYPLERMRANHDFAARYQAAFKEPPRIYADNTYDSLFLIERAWWEAKAQKLSLPDALRKTSWKGLVGEYRYSPRASFGLGRSSLVCFRRGELELR